MNSTLSNDAAVVTSILFFSERAEQFTSLHNLQCGPKIQYFPFIQHENLIILDSRFQSMQDRNHSFLPQHLNRKIMNLPFRSFIDTISYINIVLRGVMELQEIREDV